MSEITVPAMGESITEGTIFKWHVKEGDAVNQGDVLLELETDKVNLEISAEESGVVEKILRNDGDTVQIGEVLGRISAGGEAAAAAPAKEEPKAPEKAAPAPAAPSAPAPAESAKEGDSYLAASPAARKLAREQVIDLEQVNRDPKGRIFQDNVKSHAEAPAPRQSAPAPTAPPAEVSQPGKPAERTRMSRRRATIAKRLVEAQHTAAMLTTFNEVDMTAIMDVRKRRKDAFKEKHEIGLGFMSFFTKAVVGALKKFPHLNAEIDGEDIIVKKYYDRHRRIGEGRSRRSGRS